MNLSAENIHLLVTIANNPNRRFEVANGMYELVSLINAKVQAEYNMTLSEWLEKDRPKLPDVAPLPSVDWRHVGIHGEEPMVRDARELFNFTEKGDKL